VEKLITSLGKAVLQARLTDLVIEYQDICGQKKEAYENGGNGWHDNFAYEDLLRQEKTVELKILEVEKILSSAIIVRNFPSDCKTLQIGHIAKFLDKFGNESVYHVVGIGESDLSASPPKVEYLAPVIKDFFGEQEGMECGVVFVGVEKVYELVKILNPTGEENVYCS
jgi:transcription elongation GreA/GreB family factor